VTAVFPSLVGMPLSSFQWAQLISPIDLTCTECPTANGSIGVDKNKNVNEIIENLIFNIYVEYTLAFNDDILGIFHSSGSIGLKKV
jgi:hypothetical protein